MCGRFTLRAELERLAELYAVLERPNLAPRYNIAPTDPVAAVRSGGDGSRHLAMLRWGLVLPWSDGSGKGKPLINARAETVATKGAFRESFAARRCLVIADGFYEWQKREDGSKQAYFMTRGDDEVFAFAGLWTRWTPRGEGQPLDSCCIVTTDASEALAPIHHRMPVILSRADEGVWLDPVAGPDDLAALLGPAEDITARPVSPHVNKVANDDPACVAPPGDIDGGDQGPGQMSLL